MAQQRSKKKRRPLDAYYTSQALVLPLFAHVNSIKGHVLEPTAGEGAISSLLEMHPRVDSVFTNDINTALKTNAHIDAESTSLDLWLPQGENAPRRYDCLITNPPFNIAAQILRNAWATEITTIALLLRLSFLEPTTGRGKLYGRKFILQELSGYMTHLIVFGSNRPSYTGDGNTDSVTTAWMVWNRNAKNSGAKIIPVADWELKKVTREDVLDVAIPF